MYWNIEFNYNYRSIGFGIFYALLLQVYYHAGAVKKIWCCSACSQNNNKPKSTMEIWGVFFKF